MKKLPRTECFCKSRRTMYYLCSVSICATHILFFFFFYAVNGQLSTQGQVCVKKDFGFGSFVCVCNATFCDALQPVATPLKGNLVHVTSDKGDKRWHINQFSMADEGKSESTDRSATILRVNRNETFQKILGFGGAFTDSAGINLRSVSPPLQDHVIRGYFGDDGLEYNLGRVPIGGADFSTHPYSYDDLPPGQVDITLKYFAITKEDYDYKIPYINQASLLASKRGVNLKLLGSPWSGPGWMKTNGKINGTGRLRKEFYAVWASYIIRFLEAYKRQGISFFGVTAQNEPTAGYFYDYAFNQMAWDPKEQGIWVGENLGPQLHGSGFENVSIFILDDQRFFLPMWAVKVFEQGNASKYVGGIAVHWYWDPFSPSTLLDWTHGYFPDVPLLYTEACEGWAPWELKKVIPGSWVRAEHYAKNIIQNLQHWVVGWIDWNLALNLEGGPNWVQNFVDSPVLVNMEQQEIYKQPMYYALAHFSKILPEGSVRVAHEVDGPLKQYVDVVAFRRPDGSIAAVMANANRFSLSLELRDEGISYKMTLGPRSIVSLVWNC